MLRPPMSWFSRTVLGLVIVNACLVLFLTFGAVFPSRLSVSELGSGMPDSFYDHSAKSSPFHVTKKPKQRRPTPIPVISARSTSGNVTPASYNSLK
jgi:hypothetical protein